MYRFPPVSASRYYNKTDIEHQVKNWKPEVLHLKHRHFATNTSFTLLRTYIQEMIQIKSCFLFFFFFFCFSILYVPTYALAVFIFIPILVIDLIIISDTLH